MDSSSQKMHKTIETSNLLLDPELKGYRSESAEKTIIKEFNVDFPEYQAWFDQKLAEEGQLWYFDYLWLLLAPMTLWYCYIFSQNFTLLQWVMYVGSVTFIEMFAFVNAHVCGHTLFMQNKFDDKRKYIPFAFYHHYDKRALNIYDSLPHSYISVYSIYFGPLVFWFNFFGVNKYIIFPFFTLFLFDIALHQYFHSKARSYASWSIFKFRNRYLYFAYETCRMFGMASIDDHKTGHHGHHWTDRDTTEDFVDLKVPIVGYIGDKYANVLYVIYKKVFYAPGQNYSNQIRFTVVAIWYPMIGYLLKQSEPLYLENWMEEKMNWVEFILLSLFTFYFSCGPGFENFNVAHYFD